MSDRVKKVLLILSAFLIVLMVAVVTYLAKQNKNLKLQATISPIATSTLTETQEPIKTATALVSLTPLASQTATQTATEAAKSKEDLIKEAFAVKSSTSIDKISISISKSSDNSAYGSVTIDDEGGWFLAAYENGSWVILGDGNGTLNCSILSGHDVPSSVVGECYDMATDNLVKR